MFSMITPIEDQKIISPEVEQKILGFEKNLIMVKGYSHMRLIRPHSDSDSYSILSFWQTREQRRAHKEFVNTINQFVETQQ
ncbi:MAG: hypothetical protein AAF490_29360 [Chloroflexota bacterium]